MNFDEVCFRLHEPRWAVYPLSGTGAALNGSRFGRKGMHTLYLATSLETAYLEVLQGLTIAEPHTLVCYRVDGFEIADLRTADGRKAHSASLDDMACTWKTIADAGDTPASWLIADRLIDHHDGMLVSSFAPGADPDKHFNLVLWKWNRPGQTRVAAYDPRGRLPKDQRSWGTP